MLDTNARLPHLLRVASLALALGLSAAALASDQAVEAPVETLVEAEVSVRGTVTAIDVANRLVTLETGTGLRALPVHPEVADLEHLRVGDVIDVRYHRSILFDIQPAGTAEPGAYISEEGRAVDRDEGVPARIGQQVVTVLAEVVEVDASAGSFSVRGPAGNVRTLHAETPRHVEAVARIRVGDLLRVRFREGLAVALARVEMH